MKRRSIALSLLLLAAFALPVRAQKDVSIDGQVKVGVHKFKLDNNNLYQFEVKAKNFVPNFNLFGYYIPNTIPFGKEQNFRPRPPSTP
jgi:hypothetical protein